MEHQPNFENRESMIDSLIENPAKREEMNPADVLSDIGTFVELSLEDQDAKAYLEEVAEKLGISVEELVTHAAKRRDNP